MNPARQAALSSSASLQTPPCDLSLSLSKPHHNMRASQSLPKKIPVRTKVTVVQGKFLLFSLKQRMLEIPIKWRPRYSTLCKKTATGQNLLYYKYQIIFHTHRLAYSEVRGIISRSTMERRDSSWEEIACSVPSKTDCKRQLKNCWHGVSSGSCSAGQAALLPLPPPLPPDKHCWTGQHTASRTAFPLAGRWSCSLLLGMAKQRRCR